MKIVPGFVLREVAGKSVAISINPALPFRGMLSLNSTARFLWDKLESGCEREDLYTALVDTYGIDRETAVRDADNIVDMLLSHGILV
jgi:hypothetical protein